MNLAPAAPSNTLQAIMTVPPHEPQPVAELIQRGRDIGLTFPRNPTNPDGVQIRVSRGATPEAHEIVAELRGRRAEVDSFFGERRPAWPKVDDGLPPLPDPAEVPHAIYMLHLEAILIVDEVREAIHEIVEDAGRRILHVRADALGRFDERAAFIVGRAADKARQDGMR